MKKYSIHAITNIDEALSLSNTLLNFSPPTETLAPSLQVYWLSAFLQNYGKSRKIAVTVISEGEMPRMIAPFQHTSDDTMEFLCDETSDYNDFLFENGIFDVNLIQPILFYWFSKGIKKIKLDKFPHDSLSLKFLRTVVQDKRIEGYIENCDEIPVVIPETDKPLDFWHGAKSKWIKRYQRSLRRLNKKADVTFSLVESLDELRTVLPIIRELHIKRWGSKGISSKFLDERRASFVTEICEYALKTKSLFLPIMKINGVIAAYRIGFRGGNTIFDWNTAFALEFSKWSPGGLLVLNILSNAKIWNFAKYNFLRGHEQYKLVWTNRIEQTISVTINSINTN
jgi:CelD/BcsL family acetyltransferase involved in cellulose biosynthesis